MGSPVANMGSPVANMSSPVANMGSPVAKMNPPVAGTSLCPTSFSLHQTPTSIKPIEICTTLSNECQPLLVHHIPFCFRCQGSKGKGICAFTIIIMLLESSFHDSVKAGFPFVQKLHIHLQNASHGRLRNMPRSCLEFSFCFEWLDPISLFFKLMVPLFGSV